METISNKFVGYRPYEFPDDTHMSVSFEFNLSLNRVDRTVYSILDWIGDIGGLREGLTIILAFTFGVFKFSPFEHYMVEQLYVKSPDSSYPDDLDQIENKPEHFKDSETSLLR